jgi:hypothetical protein
MSFKTEFKLLARVKIRLGFYLDDGDKSFFEETPAVQNERLRTRKYDIRQDLLIEPTAECLRQMALFGLIWRTDNEGFFLSTEIKSDTMTVLRPFPQEGIRLAFLIKIRKSDFPNFANQRLGGLDVPFRYYFTNGDAADKSYPCLSAGVLPLAILKQHLGKDRLIEMGEYGSRISSILVSQAIESTDAAKEKSWKDNIPTRFVHTGDRLALPKSFAVGNVLNLDAELKSVDGQDSIRKISIKNSAKSSARIDFSTFVKDEETHPVPDGAYQLVMSGDITWDNPMKKEPEIPTVFLFDALADPTVWGIVEIVHDPDLPADFRIQEPGNTLPARVPEFEIRLASRLTFWKYFGKNIPSASPGSVHALTRVSYLVTEGTKKYTSPETTFLEYDKAAKRFVSEIHL